MTNNLIEVKDKSNCSKIYLTCLPTSYHIIATSYTLIYKLIKPSYKLIVKRKNNKKIKDEKQNKFFYNIGNHNTMLCL